MGAVTGNPADESAPDFVGGKCLTVLVGCRTRCHGYRPQQGAKDCNAEMASHSGRP